MCPSRSPSRVMRGITFSRCAATAVLALAACPVAQAADPPVAGTVDLARPTRPGTSAGGFDERHVGRTLRGRAGQSVALLGDLNGDGRQDYAIGMPRAGAGGT